MERRGARIPGAGGTSRDYTLVFTFDQAPLDGTVAIKSGQAVLASAPVASGNTLRVELTPVTARKTSRSA